VFLFSRRTLEEQRRLDALKEARVWRKCLAAFDPHTQLIPELDGLSKDPTQDAEIIHNMGIVDQQLKRDHSNLLHTYYQFGHYYSLLRQNCERGGTDFFPLLNQNGIKYTRRYWLKLHEFFRLASTNRKMLTLTLSFTYITSNIKSFRSLCTKGNFK